MLKQKCYIIIVLLLISACSHTPTTMHPLIKKTISINNKPINSLNHNIRINIPSHAKTVGDIADYLLEGTSYQLLIYCDFCNKDAQRIINEPISPLLYASDRHVTQRQQALVLAAGSEAQLIIDHDLNSITYGYLPGEGEARIRPRKNTDKGFYPAKKQQVKTYAKKKKAAYFPPKPPLRIHVRKSHKEKTKKTIPPAIKLRDQPIIILPVKKDNEKNN